MQKMLGEPFGGNGWYIINEAGEIDKGAKFKEGADMQGMHGWTIDIRYGTDWNNTLDSMVVMAKNARLFLLGHEGIVRILFEGDKFDTERFEDLEEWHRLSFLRFYRRTLRRGMTCRQAVEERVILEDIYSRKLGIKSCFVVFCQLITFCGRALERMFEVRDLKVVLHDHREGCETLFADNASEAVNV